jgi:catechol 2,3-dioxygenase-like lactoylglutathione lyase family enzyme
VTQVQPTGFHHVSINVTDLERSIAFYTELRNSGVEVRGPVPIGSARQAFVSDPDGNAIELQAG